MRSLSSQAPLLLSLVLAGGCPDDRRDDTDLDTPADPHAAGDPCASCHTTEQASWSNSHHARASTPVRDLTRFDGRSLRVGTLHATPRLEAGQPEFLVQDGAGAQHYPVVGVIGVEPLQQYLLDAGRGRRLVAPMAWDTRERRWFDPAPGGAVGDPNDPLYWAGIAGTWNHLCGECHTTGFQKGYDEPTDTYRSTSSHDAVSCEACHGNGDRPLALDTAEAQLNACAPCHSRRQTLGYGATPDTPFLDYFRPGVVGTSQLGADGRPQAPTEPFEWALFAQSAKHRAGVTCTNCHDPHSAKAKGAGNSLCTGCHADVEADPKRHPPAGACVDCHMPSSTYMGIHTRHDHGIRRPGDSRHAHIFGPALNRDVASVPGLVNLATNRQEVSFDRASALALLRRFPPPDGMDRIVPLARDADGEIRVEAVTTLGAWGQLQPLGEALEDPLRAVRFAALEGLVAAGASGPSPAWGEVATEYETYALQLGDLASSWQNVGLIRIAAGDRPGAIAAFRASVRRDPHNEAAVRALAILGAP